MNFITETVLAATLAGQSIFTPGVQDAGTSYAAFQPAPAYQVAYMRMISACSPGARTKVDIAAVALLKSASSAGSKVSLDDLYKKAVIDAFKFSDTDTDKIDSLRGLVYAEAFDVTIADAKQLHAALDALAKLNDKFTGLASPVPPMAADSTPMSGVQWVQSLGLAVSNLTNSGLPYFAAGDYARGDARSPKLDAINTMYSDSAAKLDGLKGKFLTAAQAPIKSYTTNMQFQNLAFSLIQKMN